MHVMTYNSAASFLARTQSWLEQHEANNNVILGIAELLRQKPDRYVEWYLLTVEDDSDLKVAALWTPPSNLTLSAESPDPEPLTLLAQHFQEQGVTLPGVTAQVDTARVFADAWIAIAGGGWRDGLHMRLFELRQVIPPAHVMGQLMQAAPAQQSLAAQWIYDFEYEALGHGPTLESAALEATRLIERGALYLFVVEDEPVSMAAHNRETTHGTVIGTVYTPPEQRGHGYASALVAQCSQMALDSGKSFCVLFTDLKNPTSNKIYQNIGYVPLDDFDDLKFIR